MAEIRWAGVIVATVIVLAICAAALYFTAKSDPLNNATNIDLFVPGCIVRFMPDGSHEIIKFGGRRCP